MHANTDKIDHWEDDDMDDVQNELMIAQANNGKNNNNSQLTQVTPDEQEAQDQVRVRFSDLHPAQEKVVKHGALQFDIKLGWVPKAQISGPIPIAFSHPDVDDLLAMSISKSSIIYLGYRPTNSFDIHRQFYKEGQNYPFNQFHLCKSQFLQRFFKKYYSDYEFDEVRHQGMVINDSPLIFDSFFQGGNLDAVYYEQGQYRLMTRVDTNTRGHCITDRVKCGHPGTYKFRIVNMSKRVSLYQRGMRPYVRTNLNPIWKQDGMNVRYGPSVLGQEFELSTRMYSLKFEYEFTGKQNYVEFCYGIPFVYSDLLRSLTQYRLNSNFHLNKLCYSLSGIEIPLVTITEVNRQEQSENLNTKKHVIAISARVHPGETHGSHLINGFIRALLSNTSEAAMLRKNIIFKIIPMINPDGVIIGNTRTSLAGKDLNRVYTDNTDFVFPQVIGIRDFANKLKQKYQNKFLFFIDIHGHSARNNSFFYGPQYSVFDEQYTKCRLLPKIFSHITSIFRYYSCKFRLSSFKQKTCRGYFNSNNIVRTYTYETSMHSYFNFDERRDEPFDQQKLQNLGESLMLAIHGYVNSVIKLDPIPIPQPPQKIRKVRKKKIEQNNELEQSSDDMKSEKADSEDSTDDLGKNQLQVFFNRINENRQYFYEQLMAFNKIPVLKSQKKIKKKDIESQKQTIQNVQITQKQQLKVQTIKPNLKNKSQWIPKIQFSPRKKSFLEYQKISNVIFGSSSSNFNPTKYNLLYSSRPSLQNFSSTKYVLVDNPSLHTITKHKKYDSVLSKIPDLKVTSKARFFNSKDQNSSKNHSISQSNRNKAQKMQTIQNKLKKQQSKQKILLNSDTIQKFVLQSKPFVMLQQIESKKTLKQDIKAEKQQILRTTSLRILPRKKSIKNFKQSQQRNHRKPSKKKSQKGLLAKLPSIEKVMPNF